MRYTHTHTHRNTLLRNEIGSFAETQMDLETVIQSEVSQKEKSKYCILTHIRGFPDGSADKESSTNAGDTVDVGLIPGSGRSPGGGDDNPL